MNAYTALLLHELWKDSTLTQRELASRTGLSLGIVNSGMKALRKDGFIDKSGYVTNSADEQLNKFFPKNAVILAAGFGMRMVPINTLVPKALLEINGEPLIERLIKQLHEVGIFDITIVVGFLKERFEYLIDQYNVSLVINPEYASKNNLHSLYLASSKIENTYIIPCDLWFQENPFDPRDCFSWYMMKETEDSESNIRITRSRELVTIKSGEKGNPMVGLSYVCSEDGARLKNALIKYEKDPLKDQCFWEEALLENGRMLLHAKIVSEEQVSEINTYEQLREMDEHSSYLNTEAIDVIAQVFDVDKNSITHIQVLKKGMTNRSFKFTVKDWEYIMRIPGEGTNLLINRQQEAAVYQTIQGLGLCDDVVYLNPRNGYKITRFLKDVRVCDPESIDDLSACMKKLKAFHDLSLNVPHTFDLFHQIEFYEQLWGGQPSIYRDYELTKKHVLDLKQYVETTREKWCLTHIDAVPDNFLFYKHSPDGAEELQLTDWEYAGMQDPHVDIAMFSIYSLYTKDQADRLIDIYFEGSCPEAVKTKIYCYIAICGLLWSNWCEYKRMLGVEFGEYSIRQYRYAKEFYRIAKERGAVENA